MLSLWILSTNILAGEERSSSLPFVSQPRPLALGSPNHGRDSSLLVSSWESESVPKMRRSQFTPQKWRQLAFVGLWSCSGSCGWLQACRFSPRSSRPSLTGSVGIFLGFCANVIVKDTGRIAWRLQLGSAFIPSFILAAGIWFCPESPRWLMKKGNHAKAFRSMSRLRAHPIIAARDYYYSCVIFEEEKAVAGGSGYFTRLWDCFAVPRIRRANYGASTVMIAQQMCGINSKRLCYRPPPN